MTPDLQTARALAARFTAPQIRDFQTHALKVKMEGGTISRSYDGSSFTINIDNCSQIISDTTEALTILDTTAAAENRDLTAPAVARGIDFRHRITG